MNTIKIIGIEVRKNEKNIEETYMGKKIMKLHLTYLSRHVGKFIVESNYIWKS